MSKLLSLLFLLVLQCSAAIGNELAEPIDIGIPVFVDSVSIPEPADIDDQQKIKITGLTPECINTVSRNYGIHTDVLFAILLVEGGKVGDTNKGNTDGTKDIGIFQINEINLPELSAFGIERSEVMNNGCLAAAIASRHLLKSIKGQPTPHTPMEYLSLLARYHSKSKDKNAIYALKLKRAFEMIYAHDDLLYKTDGES